jgi:hypothetical protein
MSLLDFGERMFRSGHVLSFAHTSRSTASLASPSSWGSEVYLYVTVHTNASFNEPPLTSMTSDFNLFVSAREFSASKTLTSVSFP